jgi:hypothetical protein
MRQTIGFASEFYRQLLRAQTGAPHSADREMAGAVERAAQWAGDDVETTAACLERTLAALAHIDRNAHQGTLIECWLDDLAQIRQTGQPIAGRAE